MLFNKENGIRKIRDLKVKKLVDPLVFSQGTCYTQRQVSKNFQTPSKTCPLLGLVMLSSHWLSSSAGFNSTTKQVCLSFVQKLLQNVVWKASKRLLTFENV